MTVVIGVCRVLSCYWEMIPAHVIKSLLVTLVKDLAFDSSSPSVRVAVLQVSDRSIIIFLLFSFHVIIQVSSQ